MSFRVIRQYYHPENEMSPPALLFLLFPMFPMALKTWWSFVFDVINRDNKLLLPSINVLKVIMIKFNADDILLFAVG